MIYIRHLYCYCRPCTHYKCNVSVEVASVVYGSEINWNYSQNISNTRMCRDFWRIRVNTNLIRKSIFCIKYLPRAQDVPIDSAVVYFVFSFNVSQKCLSISTDFIRCVYLILTHLWVLIVKIRSRDLSHPIVIVFKAVINSRFFLPDPQLGCWTLRLRNFRRDCRVVIGHVSCRRNVTIL